MASLALKTFILTGVVADAGGSSKQCLLQQNKRAELEATQTTVTEVASHAKSSKDKFPVHIDPRAMEDVGRALANGGGGIATSFIGGRTVAQTAYTRMGAGSCLLANGLEPLNNQFPGRGSECSSICSDTLACRGYSATLTNCMIWTDGPLQAGGQTFAEAECFAKSGSEAREQVVAPAQEQQLPDLTIAQQSAVTSSGGSSDELQQQNGEAQAQQVEAQQVQTDDQQQQQQQQDQQQEQQQDQHQQQRQQGEQEQEQDQTASQAAQSGDESSALTTAAEEGQNSAELHEQMNALRAELANAKEATAASDAHVAELDQQLRVSDTQNTQLQQSLQMASGQSDSSQQQIAQLQEQLAAAEQAAKKASSSGGKIAQMEEQLERATHAAKAATDNTRTLQQQLARAQQAAKQAAQDALSQKALANTEKKRAAAAEAANQKVKALERELAAAKTSNEEFDKKVAAVQQELSLSNRIVEASGRKTAKLREELTAAKKKLAETGAGSASTESLLGDYASSTETLDSSHAAHTAFSSQEDVSEDVGTHRSFLSKHESVLDDSLDSEAGSSRKGNEDFAIYKGRLYKRDSEAAAETAAAPASEPVAAFGTHHRHYASQASRTRHHHPSDTLNSEVSRRRRS